jgi:hypothetical protein
MVTFPDEVIDFITAWKDEKAAVGTVCEAVCFVPIGAKNPVAGGAGLMVAK